MYFALNSKGNRVFIDDVISSETYFCPQCRNFLIIKNKGFINKHHFAHKGTVDCDSWAHQMSDWHLNWQKQFDENYREIIIGCHRADIKINNIIVEFQQSPLSSTDMLERINYYTKHNNYLFFLFDLREPYKKERIYPCTYRFTKKDHWWKNPRNSIIPPRYPGLSTKKYDLFFQLTDNEILWVKTDEGSRYTISWKKIHVKKVLSKKDFITLVYNKALKLK